MKFSAILFDLDGTLVDTITLYERGFMQALAEYGKPVTLTTFQDWYVRGTHLRDIAKILGFPEEDIPRIRLRRDELYRELLTAETEWLPGAEDLLKTVKAAAPIGIITGSWLQYLEAMRPRTDIFPYANTIVTADDIHMLMKPHPHGLLLAADRLGIAPEHCIYIGDQVFDIQAANAAGMTSCLVIGKHTPQEAQKGAAIICNSLHDIAQHL